MKWKYVLIHLVLLLMMGEGFADPFYDDSNTENSAWLNDEIKAISEQAENINPSVLKLSLSAYLKAKERGLADKELLTIVDYTKPSIERRLWVIDLKNEKVLFNTWVSHGKNSGTVNATSFSNKINSFKSSVGVFVTDEDAYVGNRGYSLRLHGLEPDINDNAYRRNIVFHGASYVNKATAQRNGMLGRTLGCLAVSKDMIKQLIDTIKDNTVVVAYYPDKTWLKKSDFITTDIV
jgi:hypothetical protein